MTNCQLFKQIPGPNPERDNPPTAEAAVCFQLHDTLMLAWGAGRLNNETAHDVFWRHWDILKQQMSAFEQRNRPAGCCRGRHFAAEHGWVAGELVGLVLGGEWNPDAVDAGR